MINTKDIKTIILNYEIRGVIKKGRSVRVARVLNGRAFSEELLPSFKFILPDWQSEITYIQHGRGLEYPTLVACDLYIENSEGQKIAFWVCSPFEGEYKAQEAREGILRLMAMTEPKVGEAYFVLLDEPGKYEEYFDWHFIERWFGAKSPLVLFNSQLRELIGLDFARLPFLKGTVVKNIDFEFYYRLPTVIVKGILP